ncbi:M23 family metallopeptidase [Curtobacterium sp. MCSS17_007]|uniref:M23 family metallopeptidase n=1 Tax=Curtobacterium sp. MCSS17_007 TaxID=2175646 RepID=UPI001C64F2EF|nr:M23 family metallopeptidase [Curtobacterium sp. MCSS17_007]WIE76213.1 M23 family metallopeptidase [Curtobacterium sp. MCSS17_007]
MTTTDDRTTLPLRPRGAARRAANAEAMRASRVGRPTTGAAVPPPAVPVPTSRLPTSRVPATLQSTVPTSASAADRPGPARARRRRRDRSPAAAGGQPRPRTAQARQGAFPARALPATASALAACLVVSVSTPAAAVDGPVGSGAGIATSVVAPDGQHYRAAPGVTVTVTRDDFAVHGRPQDDLHRGPRITTGGAVVRPVDGRIPTAGGFGGRQVAGCGACSTNHRGLDFAAPAGTPVLAVTAGRVVSAGPLGGYGNQVLLVHPDGTQTRYGHLSRIDVVPGQFLAAGEQLGAVGSTGISTGAHLHFEVIVGGTPVDPAPWLAARGLS